MIEYRLRDEAGTVYNLNTSAVTTKLKETTTQNGDSFSFENKIVKKSYLPGSVMIGKSRLESREFALVFERVAVDDATYRNELNALCAFVKKTVYIEDITNNMRLKVAVVSINIEYEPGALKKFSSNEIVFVALNPYWENLTEDSYTGTTVSNVIKVVSLTNSGYLDSPPIITLVTTAAVNSVQCYLTASNVGIQINDALFGTTGNLTMVIDCEKGTVIVGSTNLYNRNVAEGTGYFEIPVGADSLNILCANVACTYTITFRKRYFL